jgi:hypothetical protein
MRRSSPGAQGLSMKAAMARPLAREKTMRLLTYLELSRCTKAELWDLYCRALLVRTELSPASAGSANALLNMHRFRMFLSRRGYTPSL